MGHEAFGLWFSEELSANAQKIARLLDAIVALENRTAFETSFTGVESELTLTRDDAQITPLLESLDELPEDTDLSEDSSHAQCGLSDLKAALLSWQTFVGATSPTE